MTFPPMELAHLVHFGAGYLVGVFSAGLAFYIAMKA